MNSQLSRALKRAGQEAARQTVEGIAPNVDTALHNEFVTRQRVEALEARLDSLKPHVNALLGFKARPFLGRLRWLLLGR